jgi:hypothetical protein
MESLSTKPKELMITSTDKTKSRKFNNLYKQERKTPILMSGMLRKDISLTLNELL